MGSDDPGKCGEAFHPHITRAADFVDRAVGDNGFAGNGLVVKKPLRSSVRERVPWHAKATRDLEDVPCEVSVE